jgi:sugar phosphate permease
MTIEYSTLIILFVIFSYNQLCRQVIYYYSDFSDAALPFTAMNKDLNFNKEEYATLASYGFTLSYILATVVAGTFADRYNRSFIIFLSCISWSVLTLLQGDVRNFTELLLLRSFLGVSQAFLNPAAYSIISEIFPTNFVATANSIYSTGIYLGGGLASLSIELDYSIGWRRSLMTIGSIGIFLSLLGKYVIRDPREQRSGEINKPQTIINSMFDNLMGYARESYQDVASLLRNYQLTLILLASVFRFFAGFTISIWKAPFIFQKFPNNYHSFAKYNAIVITLGGMISSFSGGLLSDYFHDPKRRLPIARCWLPAISSFLAIPFWILFLKSSSLSFSFLALFCEYVFAECWIGPTLTSLLSVTPKQKRGLAQSLFAFLTAIGNFGPMMVSFVVKWDYSLENSLAYLVTGSYFLAGIVFILAGHEEQKRLDSEGL